MTYEEAIKLERGTLLTTTCVDNSGPVAIMCLAHEQGIPIRFRSVTLNGDGTTVSAVITEMPQHNSDDTHVSQRSLETTWSYSIKDVEVYNDTSDNQFLRGLFA